MKRYRWEGFHAHTLVWLTGEIEAENGNAAMAQLQTQDLIDIQLRRISRWSRDRDFSSMEFLRWVAQFAELLTAKIPISQALGILTSFSVPSVQQRIQRLQRLLDQGVVFSEAFAQFSGCVDEWLTVLIRLGETSGTLELRLLDWIRSRERQEQLKARLSKALFYPGMILCFSGVVTVCMLWWVVPQFVGLFESVHAVLPWVTAWMIDISEGLRHRGGMLCLGMLGMGLLCCGLWRKSERFRMNVYRFFYKIPWVRGLLKDRVMAKICHQFEIALLAELPLLASFELALRGLQDPVMRGAWSQVEASIRQGVYLTDAIQKIPVLNDPYLVPLLMTGEQTGLLGNMFGRASDLYDRKLQNALENMIRWVEPISMAMLGLWVGGLVLALYLPLFQIGQVIS